MHTASAHDDYWCPAGEDVQMISSGPISGEDWIALLKIANGDWSIPATDFACLLERKLIEISEGVVKLTQGGYIALGLPV